ncbi:hypothetical protein LUZ60_014269 [Juncus effusus]|nr:hypothetical protein LUZ60_014269 [Juncus effusus]
MWVEILCCLVLYKLFRRFIPDDLADDFLDVDCSHSDVLFSVASRLEKLYGGKCFVGLRIPDPDSDSGSRQHIDLVLVTNKEIMVVAVRNFAGFVQVGTDGNWTCVSHKNNAIKSHPDPVLEISSQIMTLQSYLEQRGALLPKGHITGRVILPNPNCQVSRSIEVQTEVLTFKKWRDLKPDSKIEILSWINFKDYFPSKNGENQSQNQEAVHQNINFILSTSPMWDRLELRGDKNVLGEFIEFKGHQGDLAALQKLKRSKVSRIVIQKSSLFSGRSRIQILYSPRDYRSDASSSSSSSSSSEMKDIAVKPHTEIIFQPLNANKTRKFKISSVVSLTLSS